MSQFGQLLCPGLLWFCKNSIERTVIPIYPFIRYSRVVNIRKKTVWISHHFLLPAFIASGVVYVFITSQLLFNDLFVYCNIMLYYSLMGKIILAAHWATQHLRLYFSYCFCPQKKAFWIAITVNKCSKLV